MTARLTVDLGAVERNYQRLCAAASGACAAVVKADAYGMGLARIAQRLASAGCVDFFVATAAEGAALRSVLPEARIFVFEGASATTLATLVEAHLVPVINHPRQLSEWQRTRPIAVHVDTGMQRLGFVPDEVTREALEGFEVCLLMSHLACADQPSHPANTLQLERFESVCARVPGIPLSLGNSAAILGGLAVDDLARPGIALYGGNPFSDRANPVEAVATLSAEVLQVRNVSAGEGVGYGWTFQADSPRRLATLGIGYADGLPRLVSNVGHVLADQIACPIVGRVTMDFTVVDITDARLDVGDAVEVFGANLPADTVAGWAQSFSYELFCSVGARVERIYV